MQILKRYANIYFVDLQFWIKDLKNKYYKNHIYKNKIKSMTLWSIKTYYFNCNNN